VTEAALSAMMAGVTEAGARADSITGSQRAPPNFAQPVKFSVAL